LPTTSKTAHVVLAATTLGIGVVQILQAERYYRRRLALHAAEMHQALLAEIASDEELQAAWAAPDEQPPASDYARLVHCNRQVSLLSAKFRAGLLDRHTLRVQAQWLMRREIGRTYWRQSGAFRETEARDRTDRVFNAILDDEYTAAAEPDTVTA
jgi:uncharacterized protein with PIN domain